MKTSNKTSGNRFEQEFADLVHQYGFWVHVMQQNKSGQPADIIAVKGSHAILIDCKEISDHKGFPFSRAEENQRLAMRRFFNVTGNYGWFAMKLPGGELYMLGMHDIERMEAAGKKSIPEQEILEECETFAEWIRHYSDGKPGK